MKFVCPPWLTDGFQSRLIHRRTDAALHWGKLASFIAPINKRQCFLTLCLVPSAAASIPPAPPSLGTPACLCNPHPSAPLDHRGPQPSASRPVAADDLRALSASGVPSSALRSQISHADGNCAKKKKKFVSFLCVSESCFSCACNKTRKQQKKLVSPLADAGLSGNSCPVRRRPGAVPELWEPAKRPKCLVILLHAALHLWAVDTKVALHSPCFCLPRCRKENKALRTRSVSGFLFVIDLFLKSSKWKGWSGSSGSRSAAAQAARGRCRLRQGD